jgi:hypothetical protein
MTTWLNPGNISRISRGDTSRGRIPAVLRMDIAQDGSRSHSLVHVPHLPFDEVFHPVPEGADIVAGSDSVFVRGLAELEGLKTQGGAGLIKFLEENLGQFPSDVAKEIMILTKEICPDGQ